MAHIDGGIHRRWTEPNPACRFLQHPIVHQYNSILFVLDVRSDIFK